jgi:hypothetical protein
MTINKIQHFEFGEYEGSDRISGRIEAGDDGLAVFIDGYGECTSPDGNGAIIILEKYQGRLRVLVWDDIREENPKVVDVECASESRRLPN